jgi:apolipoprotein N-acyltransferase
MIWNESESGRRFQQLLDLTRKALNPPTAEGNPTNQALTRPPATLSDPWDESLETRTNATDLLLWPEAALPNVGQNELITLSDLVREYAIWMIFGADDVASRPDVANTKEVDYFNASVLLNPDGEPRAVYHKRKLVMFGEYVPFTRWLPFVKYFTPITGGFTPGERSVPFEFAAGELGVKTSTLICFEDIFPDLVRDYADADTDFLVNLTNDGWFGESAAQWQHAVTALFRTVENGLPLVRCTNTGLTCWYDSTGRLREVLSDENGSIYGAGFMTVKIPLLPADERRSPTLYHQFGDCFGWLCVGLSAILLLQRTVGRKRTEEPRLSTGS